MKNIFILTAFLSSIICSAQFKISGEIKNYSEKEIMVRIFKGSTDVLINKVKTDKAGKFSVTIPQKFSGIIRITDSSRQAYMDILSDNENVSFTSDFDANVFSNIIYNEGKTAEAYQKHSSIEGLHDLNANIFPIIKKLYSVNDEFYKAVLKEEDRIKNLNSGSNLPLLNYFISVSELANTQPDGKSAADLHKEKILNRLVNDNNYLEGSGFMSKLVLDYMRSSIFGATTQEQINATVEKEIDFLLEKTDLETPRGQNILSSIFLVLPSDQFSSLLEKYYVKANSLTCEITDELKTALSAKNSTEVGQQVPNIVFSKPINGVSSLYEIKADKKIIVFWASWCPACMDEMPFIKEYYQNFKKSGGEILAISLDFDGTAFQNATKDFEWINYTELLQWDTKAAIEFGVSSTPTLFLVDKDNKLIKKASHISQLVEF